MDYWRTEEIGGNSGQKTPFLVLVVGAINIFTAAYLVANFGIAQLSLLIGALFLGSSGAQIVALASMALTLAVGAGLFIGSLSLFKMRKRALYILLLSTAGAYVCAGLLGGLDFGPSGTAIDSQSFMTEILHSPWPINLVALSQLYLWPTCWRFS